MKMSLEPCPRVLLGGTLIDGTGTPPIKDSVIIFENEWIKAVGKKNEIEIPSGAEVYNVSGMTVVPGLNDSHVHFLRMGMYMLTVLDLSNLSLNEVLEKVKERAETSNDQWIIGRGWDEAKWDEHRYITKEDLDQLVPEKPVVLTRICGHLLTLNSNAMKKAGITSETNDPPGGKIDKSENGEPTGILRDCAHLIEHMLPEPDIDTMVDGLKVASERALRLGCTSISDAGVGTKEVKAYQTALRNGYLKVRASLMLGPEVRDSLYVTGIETGFGDRMLQIGPIKLFMDGSLGAHTAALFEPYQDDADNKGLLLTEPDEIKKIVWDVHRNKCQAAVHAIGDRAIEYAITAIQEALQRKPEKNHRHRIEHCEVLTPQQVERLKELAIIPAMQPNFVAEWSGTGSMYESRLGSKRDRTTNPYRALIDEEVVVAFGSDGMPFDPIYGVWSAVNHPFKESRINLEEAVKCYTLNSAFASFEESYKGSIEVGKLADITVFEKDLTEINMDEFKECETYMTLVGGKILYHKEF
jgi:predicted amidohydrolase YtcJ